MTEGGGIMRSPRPDKPAQRGQPARTGPDFWRTPPCLAAALCKYVLPFLPKAVTIWEPACGDGSLQRTIAGCGWTVIGTDLHPQNGSPPWDFLVDEPPMPGLIVVTNGPFNRIDRFIWRCLELQEQGWIRGFVLLLRHDHLTAGIRASALNKAAWQVNCCWRPRWVAGSRGNPRWSFCWVYWAAESDMRRQPPLYVSPDAVRGWIPGDTGE
jgi:hypothetical protein